MDRSSARLTLWFVWLFERLSPGPSLRYGECLAVAPAKLHREKQLVAPDRSVKGTAGVQSVEIPKSMLSTEAGISPQLRTVDSILQRGQGVVASAGHVRISRRTCHRMHCAERDAPILYC